MKLWEQPRGLCVRLGNLLASGEASIARGKTMRTLIGLCFLAFATNIGAKVTCKENVMTSNRFCSSTKERSGESFYFFGTNDVGTVANVIFTFAGSHSPFRPDGVMVKLDDRTPFKVQAIPTQPDINCHGRGGCRWSVGAIAEFVPFHFSQFASATRMLVSFTEGKYVSDPIEVDPKKIGGWFQEWIGLTQATPLGSTSQPAKNSTP